MVTTHAHLCLVASVHPDTCMVPVECRAPFPVVSKPQEMGS